MKRQRVQYAKSQRLLLNLMLALGLVSASLPLLAPLQPANAQDFGERIRRLFDRTRPEGSASGRESGGAVRDATCMTDTTSEVTANLPSSLGLRAIVRNDNHGTTSSPYPVFYFFTSYTNAVGNGGDNGIAQLMLLDDSQYQLFDEPLIVELPETPSIVRVEIPDYMPPLQPRRSYEWKFTIICDAQEGSRNPFVEGWVERLSLDAPEDADTWHETIDELVATRRERTQEWLAFLEIYGLEALINTPVINLPTMGEPNPAPDADDMLLDDIEDGASSAPIDEDTFLGTIE